MFNFFNKKETHLDREAREASTIILATAYAIDNIRKSKFSIDTNEAYRLITMLYDNYQETYKVEIRKTKDKDKLYLVFMEYVRQYLEGRELSIIIDPRNWKPDTDLCNDISKIHSDVLYGKKTLEAINNTLGSKLSIKDIK